MEFLRQMIKGIREAWNKLSLSARVNIVLAASAVFIVMALIIFSGAQPTYVTLSANLDATEVTAIKNLLDQQDITYQISEDNTSIQVGRRDLQETRLLLAENEMPVGRGPVPPGFELFKESDLMTNQWLQDVKFMRAVQGELQRQLNAFDAIEYSYVMIREAEDELFVDEQRPSEASVVLETKRQLSDLEIKAIVNIISHAGGPNLSNDNITLTTTKGAVLKMPPETEFAALANNKLEYMVEVEKQREAKLSAKLKSLGINGTVAVSAKIDNAEEEVTDKRVYEGQEISTYIQTSTISTKESLPEGAPGAFANIPEEGAAPGGTQSNEETEDEIINYEPSTEMTVTKSQPGDVVKYIVSLVVEGDYESTTDDEGNQTQSYTGLSDTKRQLLMDLAKATVGEGESPTEVTVQDMPFDLSRIGVASAAVEEIQTAQRAQQMVQWAWTAGLILSLFIALLILRRLLSRAILRPVVEEEEEEEMGEIPEATREDLRRHEVASEITRLSLDEPEAVALLIRGWLSEEEE